MEDLTQVEKRLENVQTKTLLVSQPVQLYSFLYIVFRRKTSPFYFCDIFVIVSS